MDVPKSSRSTYRLISTLQTRPCVTLEPVRTMTIPPDCSAVHMLMMGAMPMVVPWKYTPLRGEGTEVIVNIQYV